MPTTPYLIYGTVYESDGSTPDTNASLTAKNNTTNETITTTTNGSGQYIFDCANFSSGYTNGDFITITVNESGSVGQDLRIRIDSSGIGQIKELKVEYNL